MTSKKETDIVVNVGSGFFNFSSDAYIYFKNKYDLTIKDVRQLKRHDKRLVNAVKILGDKINGINSKLIIEKHKTNKYIIDYCSGKEYVLIPEKLDWIYTELQSEEINKLENETTNNDKDHNDDDDESFIYFVWHGKSWEGGNPIDIEQYLIGCYKYYSDAKRKAIEYVKGKLKFIEPNKILDNVLETKTSICECCKEILSYDCNRGASGSKVSIYKCKPH